MNSKREILRDFNCPTNSPDSSYVQKISTHRRYFIWGRRGLTDESEHRRSPSEAARQPSFASQATSGLDMQGQSRVARLVDHIPETSHPLTRRDQRRPPLLLTCPAIPSATDAGPPTAPRHKLGLSNLLGSGGKTDHCWKGMGAKWEPRRVSVCSLRWEDAHELQIEVSAPQIFPGRKALLRLNSSSLPLRSLIFYTQADNKEKKQESGRAGTGGQHMVRAQKSKKI